MRPHRLLVVLALTGALWAPRDAAAACDAFGPYLGTGPQLPLGCPLHIYGGPDPRMEPIRRVTALRNGVYVDVTGAPINIDFVQVTVKRTFLDCQLQPVRMEDGLQSLEHAAIPLMGVAVGERVGVGSGWFGGIEIVAAGPCAAPIVPMPACTETPPCGQQPPFESFEPGGCAAGGGRGLAGGLAGGLALLGLFARRRRRR